MNNDNSNIAGSGSNELSRSEALNTFRAMMEDKARVATEELKQAGKQIRMPVAFDWSFLKTIQSPILGCIGEAFKAAEERKMPQMKDEECYELVYQFLVPPAQVREEYNRGREYFRQRAMEAVGDVFTPQAVIGLGHLVTLNLILAFVKQEISQPSKATT